VFVSSTRPKQIPGATRASVACLLDLGLSQTQIAKELGVSKPTVCFHARMLGVPPDVNYSRRYDWPAIRSFYESGHSMTACMARFGFSRNAWWDAIRRQAIVPRERLEPLEEVLAAGRRRNRNHVKRRILLAGLKAARCEECGRADWRGKPLSLELHHINGDGLDNRLENLSLLCPNCHSQTDTWGGRNRRRGKGES
jgi:hypothetical protein